MITGDSNTLLIQPLIMRLLMALSTNSGCSKAELLFFSSEGQSNLKKQ